MTVVHRETQLSNCDEGSPTPSTDTLLDTPLPRLFADLGVEVLEFVPSPDYPPCGYTVVRGGRVGLRLPSGQNRWEREIVARSMLGQVFRVPMPPLPEPFRVTEFAA